jgi:hypothetical protein
MLLGVFEHVANAGRTDSDEHLDEVGAGDRKERYLGLTGNCLGEQCLAGARVTHQEYPLRDAATQFLELRWIAQEVNEFRHFLLCLVATGNVSKSDGIC